jgi:flagellin-like hook-associated protein FlgL
MKLTLNNPLSTTASFATQKHQSAMRISGADLSTGRKTNNDIVSNILGRGLEHSSKMLRAVSKNIQYGTMIVDTAETDLNAAKDGLLKLKQTIVAANTANGRTLDILNQQYLKGEEEVKRILNQSQVNGLNLFNHDGVLNINLRVGEDINNTTTLALPDMRNQTTHLQGNANINNETRHSLMAGAAWNADDNARTAGANQIAADTFINDLIIQVDNTLNNIMAQKDNLKSTNDNLLRTAALQDEAAGNYLNTDYESTAEEFRKAIMGMRASLAILTQGEMIGQLALKLIEQ